MPSGILYPHITSVIADGVVVDPRVLLEEMDSLSGLGLDVSHMRVSNNAHDHAVPPRAREGDRAVPRQERAGHDETRDRPRVRRQGRADRLADPGPVRREDRLREKLDVVLKEKNAVLTKVYGRLPLGAERIVEDYRGYAERLRPYVADTSKVLHDGLRQGRNVLLEGAQGTMLDLDKGTYPFVTSSNPVAGYALASAGIGPTEVERGSASRRRTSPGSARDSFPTEDLGSDGDGMGERGNEFGTTTGRKRRCGWFDAVILRYAARVNGLTELFLTKLDVLSGFTRVKVCTAYRADGETFDDFPPHQSLFHRAEPVWEEVEGWEQELGGARRSTTSCGPPRTSVAYRTWSGCRSDGLGRSGSRAEPPAA